MTKYKCKNCKYQGNEFIFQFNDYHYCLASNATDPKFLGDVPKWAKEHGFGESEIGEPVGCPICHMWGGHNFEVVF